MTISNGSILGRGFMRDIRGNGFWVWVVSVFIADVINDVIKSTMRFEYNMFSDKFNIYKLLLELTLYAISFIPVYYVVESIRKNLQDRYCI